MRSIVFFFFFGQREVLPLIYEVGGVFLPEFYGVMSHYYRYFCGVKYMCLALSDK